MNWIGTATELGIVDCLFFAVGLVGCLICAVHHFFIKGR